MILVPDEMKEQLKKDIEEGKVWGLKMIKCPTEVIRSNRDAQIFGVVNEITRVDGNYFYMKIFSNITHDYVEGEGCFDAFTFYDGDILRSDRYFSICSEEKDQIQTTEYEVYHIY